MHPTDPHHVPFLKQTATPADAAGVLDNAGRRPEPLRKVDCKMVLDRFGLDPEVRRRVDQFDLPSWTDQQSWTQLQTLAGGPVTTPEEMEGCGIRLAWLGRSNPGLIGVGETPAGRVMRTLTRAELEGEAAELRRAGWGWHGLYRANVKRLFRTHPWLRDRLSPFAPPSPWIVRAATAAGRWTRDLPGAVKVGGAVAAVAVIALAVVVSKPAPAAQPTPPAVDPVAPNPTPMAQPPAPVIPATVVDEFAALLAQPSLVKELSARPVAVLRDGIGRPLAAQLGKSADRIRLVPVLWPGGVRDFPATADWLSPALVNELADVGDSEDDPVVVYLEEVGPNQQRVVVRWVTGETIAVATGRPVATAAPATSTVLVEAAEAEYRRRSASPQIPVLLAMAQGAAANPLDAYRALAVEAQIAWLADPSAEKTKRLIRRLQLMASPEVVAKLTDREREFLRRATDEAPLGPTPAEAVDKKIRLVPGAKQ